jgi:hypothetical protein
VTSSGRGACCCVFIFAPTMCVLALYTAHISHPAGQRAAGNNRAGKIALINHAAVLYRRKSALHTGGAVRFSLPLQHRLASRIIINWRRASGARFTTAAKSHYPGSIFHDSIFALACVPEAKSATRFHLRVTFFRAPNVIAISKHLSS